MGVQHLLKQNSLGYFSVVYALLGVLCLQKQLSRSLPISTMTSFNFAIPIMTTENVTYKLPILVVFVEEQVRICKKQL